MRCGSPVALESIADTTEEYRGEEGESKGVTHDGESEWVVVVVGIPPNRVMVVRRRDEVCDDEEVVVVG